MPEPKRVWNPPNPYLTEHRELLGEPPEAPLEIYEDESKSILSENDSPDLGFRWSVNPYRGCFHACSYCLHGDTPILMGDSATKKLQDLCVGDEIYGTVVRGDYRRYVKTSVQAIWSVIKPAHRITLTNDTQLIASGDHRFLTIRGWKHVTGAQCGREQRPHLTKNDKLLGVGAFVAPPQHTTDFHTIDPAIVRKKNLEGQAVKNSPKLSVVSVEPLASNLPLFDITTGTGDFIANGVISHNCYARPTHEYFGFGAGTDFERKIFVKRNAPALLEQAFRKPSWRGERIMFSGVTDCYQPLEAAWKLTQGCLGACLRYRNPVSVITKSLLIRRDAELLAALAREASASVSMSIAFLDEGIARKIEPGTPTIRRRFETMELLAKAGVPVGIGVAPVIPGLNDSDIPGLLKEAKRRGASFAFHTLLRLPGSVRSVFLHRLKEQLPLRAAKVEHRIRDSRKGALYDSRFGHRHEGHGEHWKAVEQSWELWKHRLGFDRDDDEPERPSTFRRPLADEPQLEFTF